MKCTSPSLQKENKIVGKASPFTIQTKLTIGSFNDKYEREADTMANQIMSLPQTFSSQPLSKGNDEIQRKPLMKKSESGTPVATSTLSSQLNSTKGIGNPLSSNTNSFMSNAIGADFSNVRVHTNSNAQQMNQGLNARAFTHGSDIYFNRGEYNPGSSDGKRLLGHELTHVAQQQGHTPVIQKKDKPGAKTKEPKEDKAANFLNQAVYDAAKEAFGKDKLDEYATQLGEFAINKINELGKSAIEGQKDVSPEKMLSQKSKLLGIGVMLEGEIGKLAKILLNSSAAGKFKSAVLSKLKKSPVAALGAVLGYLALIYLSGKEHEQKIGKLVLGIGAGAQGFTDANFKKASLSLGYAIGKYEVGGGVSVERGKVGDNIPEPASGMLVGVKQKDQPGDIIVKPADTIKFQFGPTFSIKDQFRISLGPTFDSSIGWGGQLALKFGNTKSYLAPAFSFDAGGNLKFSLEGRDQTHLKGLKVKAHLLYNAQQSSLKSIGLQGSFDLKPSLRNRVFERFSLGVQIDGKYTQAAGSLAPTGTFRAEGVIFLRGVFR